MLKTIIDIVLAILLVAYPYITIREIKLYKSFVKKAEILEADYKEMKRDNKVLTVYARHLVSCNIRLRNRLAEDKED